MRHDAAGVALTWHSATHALLCSLPVEPSPRPSPSTPVCSSKLTLISLPRGLKKTLGLLCRHSIWPCGSRHHASLPGF